MTDKIQMLGRPNCIFGTFSSKLSGDNYILAHFPSKVCAQPPRPSLLPMGLNCCCWVLPCLGSTLLVTSTSAAKKFLYTHTLMCDDVRLPQGILCITFTNTIHFTLNYKRWRLTRTYPGYLQFSNYRTRASNNRSWIVTAPPKKHAKFSFLKHFWARVSP